MKQLSFIFHFLGSIYCAILLILLATIYVIVGTILEAQSESHRYAASLTYNSPAFFLLLSLFFINILFSALRRWPFQRHHFPFLITHLGLLMVIAGVMIKNLWGIQGTMGILEGASSNSLFVPDTYAIHLEKRNPLNDNKFIIQEWPLKTRFFGVLEKELKRKHQGQDDLFPEVDIILSSYEPHGQEILETWFKEDFAVIDGLPPLPIYEGDSYLGSTSSLPISSYLSAGAGDENPWELIAFQTDKVSDLAKRAYLDKKKRILLAQDRQGDVFLFAFDQEGLIAHEEYLRNHLSNIIVYDRGFGGYAVQAQLPHTTIESPITFSHSPLPLTHNWEEHKPLVTLRFKKEQDHEKITLLYDPYGTGLKRPLFHGDYLVRFQPQFMQIPYRLRLRDARQINYPNAQQASSYEADVIVTDLRNHKMVEATLSMNRVYETWDGYRFYLANINPQDESSAKRVQIVVNQDPVKYIITYPGGLLVAIGIVMLFWLAPYTENNSQQRQRDTEKG